jgi:glutamate 5-kinase
MTANANAGVRVRDFSKTRSVVVKVGSKALAGGESIFTSLAHDFQVALQAHRTRRMVLVSSGAIALGLGKMGLRKRPKEVALLQAAAAAGQSLLMGAYVRFPSVASKSLRCS